MQSSTIRIDVLLNKDKIPEQIRWQADNTTVEEAQNAKAIMLSVWDGVDKSALRIDLWTQDMMVDEMADFFFQTMMTMADTYGRATNDKDAVEEMKKFSQDFYNRFREKQMKENKAT